MFMQGRLPAISLSFTLDLWTMQRCGEGRYKGHFMEERRKIVRRQADRDLLERSSGPPDRRVDPDTKAYRHKRRRAIRHNCRVQITLNLKHSSGYSDTWSESKHKVPGRILDLSGDGCSVFSEHGLEIGQSLGLKIQLRDAAIIESPGVVRWTRGVDQKNGFASGVQFVNPPAKTVKQIEKFLKELDATIGL